ncbi:MAG: hypothetical protein WA628_21415 [Terriglobales bacterium]
MKRACLLIVVPALLVALGFAQTPTASSNTDPTSIKGCLGGSDSNYTLVEDNTGHNFKLTTSSVDLKPHLGHDVTLIGHKASAVSSGAQDNSFAVTELNMISEHCAAAAVAPAASISTPADPAIPPPPTAAAVPAETIPTPADTTGAPAAASAALPATVTPTSAQPVGTPTVAAPAPAVAVPTPAETANVPPAAATKSDATAPAEPAGTLTVVAPAPAAAVPTPAETASAPPAAAVKSDATARPETVVSPKAATAHRTRMPADHPRPSATPAAAAPSAETATPVADAAKLPATDSARSETASTPDATAVTPAAAPAVIARKGSSWLWISIAVVVLIMGTLVPLINRWRKRRLLEQTDAQNLSFSHRASSDPGNSDKPRKAA